MGVKISASLDVDSNKITSVAAGTDPTDAVNFGQLTGGSGVVALVDAATIATDASIGSTFTVTITDDRTLGVPSNPTDGQKGTWIITQDGTGSRLLTLASGAGGFALGTDLASVTLSTTAGASDYIGAIYNLAADRWHVVAFVRGY